MEQIMEKINTLGKLTSELDKSKIDRDNLDRIFKDLFKQYNNEKESRESYFVKFTLQNFKIVLRFYILEIYTFQIK